MPDVFCCQCNAKRTVAPHKKSANLRTPKGWRNNKNGTLTCSGCWRQRMIVRAATFPVAEALNGTRKELDDDLRQCWQRSTCLANWGQNQLQMLDYIRQPEDTKLPPHKTVYLYGLFKDGYAGREAWEGCKNSAVAVLNGVQADYKKARFHRVFTGKRSLSSYRFPYPFPVSNQNWRAFYGDNKEPLIEVRLGSRRWILRLRGGSEMRRQLGHFAHMVAGTATRGELVFYRVRANPSDNRAAYSSAARGSAPRDSFRVMAKLVAWIPRPAAREIEGSLEFKSTPEHLLVCGDWILNCDHIKRATANHEVFLQRIAEDTKHEKRWPKEHRQAMNAHRQRRCHNFNKRVNTFCKQVASMLCGLTQRRGKGTLVVDLRDKSFFGKKFRWYAFGVAIRNAAEYAGLGVQILGNENADEQEDEAIDEAGAGEGVGDE